MRFANLVPLVASLHEDYGELGQHDGLTNGSECDLPGAFNTQTNMSIITSDGDKCRELGLLASMSLFLCGHNLRNLILEECPHEKKKSIIPDSLMDKQKHLLQGLDHVWPGDPA